MAGLQASSTLATLLVVILSRAVTDDTFIHVGMVLAVMSVVGGLLFARFLEHWL